MSPLAPWVIPLLLAAAPAEVARLECRRDGEHLYFEIALKAPADLALPGGPGEVRDTARLRCQAPRLVGGEPLVKAFLAPDAKGLTFVGRCPADAPPKQLLLDYPTRAASPFGAPGDRARATAPIDLSWPRPAGAEEALRRRWATAWSADLAARAGAANGSTLLALGQHALMTRFNADDQKTQAPRPAPLTVGFFELFTGAAALSETLALDRLTSTNYVDFGLRAYPLSRLPRIDVPGHPWRQMMADRTPNPEPLAGLVPHDNWYFALNSLDALDEGMSLLERWGGNLMRPFVLHDRDHGLRRRYETQLGLPLAELKKGPAVRRLALTGSDPFLIEGSDVTALIESPDPKALLGWHDKVLARLARSYPDPVVETTHHRGVEIYNVRTPTRELSLYRALLGNVIACANSYAAIVWVIEVFHKRHPALTDALDFQYMRTVFRNEPKQEDGFLYLSDHFVRWAVGPKTQIKAKRRREARSALTLLSHAAVVSGWEKGKVPTGEGDILRLAGLSSDDIRIPHAKAARWDAVRGQAVSDLFGTLEFSTPLVDLETGQVSRAEVDSYTAFRNEYLSLWRQFFDPIGIRFRLTPDRVHVESYILPLVNERRYNELRGWAGLPLRPETEGNANGLFASILLGIIQGDYGANISLRVGDAGAGWELFADGVIRLHLSAADRDAYEKAFWQLPMTVEIRPRTGLNNNGLDFWRFLASLFFSASEYVASRAHNFWKDNLWDGTSEETMAKFREVTITTSPVSADLYRKVIRAVEKDGRSRAGISPFLGLFDYLPKKVAPKAMYTATVNGVVLLSWSEASLKSRIEALLDRREELTAEHVNGQISVAPRGESGAALRRFLEFRTHEKALGGLAEWDALRQAGLEPARDRDAVRRLLGYVPVSPDGGAFAFDARLCESRHPRHGSLSRPTLSPTLAPGSPLAGLLDEMASASIRFRFREDGIHTTLELTRRAK